MFVIRLSCYGDDYPVPEEDISFDVRVDVDQRLVCLSVCLSVCVCSTFQCNWGSRAILSVFPFVYPCVRECLWDR